MKMSNHAKQRAQQRAIDPLIIEWLLLYGAKKYSNDGAVKRFFDRKSRKRLANQVGQRVVRLLGPLLDTVLVQSTAGETVITVAHRTKRV